MVELDALADISDTALARETAIEIADSGLPTTFVPGRNLVFFCFAGALAYRQRRPPHRRRRVQTDYSGYPGPATTSSKAMQVALGLGMDRRFVIHTPLMWIDKAATFAMAREIGGETLLNSLSRRPIAVTWATVRRILGDAAAAHARPATCGRRAFKIRCLKPS